MTTSVRVKYRIREEEYQTMLNHAERLETNGSAYAESSVSQHDTYYPPVHNKDWVIKLRTEENAVSRTSDVLIVCHRPKVGDVVHKHVHLMSMDVSSVDTPKELSCNTACEAMFGPPTLHIKKQRKRYAHKNVRINLDVVDTLGFFVVFDAYMSPFDHSENQQKDAAKLIAWLAGVMNLKDANITPHSYAELQEAAGITT